MPTGYSGTPLAKKLGFAPQMRAYVAGAPANYRRMVDPLPDGVTFARTPNPPIDLAHFFVTERRVLADRLPELKRAVAPTGAIWISWPKRASKQETDITEDVIRDIALPFGLVDIKVCAVDETWSGLKLVLRKELR